MLGKRRSLKLALYGNDGARTTLKTFYCAHFKNSAHMLNQGRTSPVYKTRKWNRFYSNSICISHDVQIPRHLQLTDSTTRHLYFRASTNNVNSALCFRIVKKTLENSSNSPSNLLWSCSNLFKTCPTRLQIYSNLFSRCSIPEFLKLVANLFKCVIELSKLIPVIFKSVLGLFKSVSHKLV